MHRTHLFNEGTSDAKAMKFGILTPALPLILAGLLTSAVLLLVACGGEQGKPASPPTIAPVGVVPVDVQRPGDPRKGYQLLVNTPYVTCGIPYSAYRQTAEPPAPRLLLPGREGRNAELPYWLTARTTDAGVELVTSNCLSCHAGFFNGELIVGLGNESIDWTTDLVLAAEGMGIYIDNDEDAVEWRKWADRTASISPYTMTDTIGVNPANNLTLALIAHRDPKTLAWSEKFLLQPPPEKPLPVSVPPWWRMKKKHAMFYSTEGRGDHARIMMTATLLCTDTIAEARKIDTYAPHIRAFIATLEPPEYPFVIDRKLSNTGREVFEKRCSGCHGTYGLDWTYPNLVISLEEIGTDPELARRAVEDADRFIHWYEQSFYGENTRIEPAPGYIAPPLDGIWATAPYLHNGSVPTIDLLLDSTRRPAYWTRSFDSRDYNKQELGWRYTALKYGKAGAASSVEKKQIYDTSLIGYSNQGHTFGDALTDNERAAVLEYLKSL